ncbi:MAG: HD domain-containing protein [Lachnospiraceae bacterium]|nr:HD domain-containing protein [Lachnospiraceae bacterium]
MNKETYKEYEKYMLSQMNDSAHDCQHIYRVLYTALNIAESENDVDMDILITACLLHDIGRQKQFNDPLICHATEGGKMAYSYLITKGWSDSKANHVKECIRTHRYRANNPPDTIEAKILFDADKIDVSGVMGISRTILYKGQTNEPLYYVNSEEQVIYENGDSFIQEYNYKLKNIYDKFYTNRGNEIAKQRQKAAVNFYNCMLDEIETTYKQGRMNLNNALL